LFTTNTFTYDINEPGIKWSNLQPQAALFTGPMGAMPHFHEI